MPLSWKRSHSTSAVIRNQHNPQSQVLQEFGTLPVTKQTHRITGLTRSVPHVKLTANSSCLLRSTLGEIGVWKHWTAFTDYYLSNQQMGAYSNPRPQCFYIATYLVFTASLYTPDFNILYSSYASWVEDIQTHQHYLINKQNFSHNILIMCGLFSAKSFKILK